MESQDRFSFKGRRGKPRPVVEKFWENVIMIPFHTCWEWAGHCDEHGYPRLGNCISKKFPDYGINGPPILKASRVSWEIHNGPIPNGLVVCHTCDNPGCVNPKHLFLGTQKDNIHDMIEKGRYKRIRGRKFLNGKVVCKYGHEKELLPNETEKYVCRTCMNSWGRRNPERVKRNRNAWANNNRETVRQSSRRAWVKRKLITSRLIESGILPPNKADLHGRKFLNGKIVCKHGHEKELLPNEIDKYVCRVCMNSWRKRNPKRRSKK
jgi:hypothetical protein